MRCTADPLLVVQLMAQDREMLGGFGEILGFYKIMGGEPHDIIFIILIT